MLVRTSNIIVITSVIFGCTCITSWMVWNYIRKKKKKATVPYNHCRTVYIVETYQQWEDVYTQLMNDLQDVKVLGLDCEWVDKNKVALLQLASPANTCTLIRLNKFLSPLPVSFQTLLADKSILKVGVAVIDDGKKLDRDYGLQVKGCVDLRHVLKRIRHNFYCPSKGLQGLAKGILGVDIDKNIRIRCGNWEAEIFSEEQINYAASDAAVAVDIFLKIVNTKLQASYLNSPERSVTSKALSTTRDEVKDQYLKNKHLLKENIKDNNKLWKLALSMCQGLIDCSYATRRHHLEKLFSTKKHASYKKDKMNCYSTRQRPLWDNCKLEAPDGALLCTCDMKKAQWYLDNKLGDKVCENPLTVRLRFEPANRPQSERNYYLQEKDNVCVVCGHHQDYVRKFVVPSEYRKYLPEKLKDHSSHDVLLLCTSCHRRSCDSDVVLRLQLAQECDAPLACGSSAKTALDHDLQMVRSAARALKTNREKIPESRVSELEEVLKNYYGVETISDDIIQLATDVDTRCNKEDYIPHGKKVVEHVKKHGSLLSFQARWRQHFLDSMNPKYLPAYWSVNYVTECWIYQSPSEV